MKPGIHVLIDIFEAPFHILNDKDLIQRTLYNLARKASVHVLHSYTHQFTPYGVSCVLVISESHFTIHTWPEDRFVAIDLFTCGSKEGLEVVIRGLLQLFHGRAQIKTIMRGEEADERSVGLSPDFRFS